MTAERSSSVPAPVLHCVGRNGALSRVVHATAGGREAWRNRLLRYCNRQAGRAQRELWSSLASACGRVYAVERFPLGGPIIRLLGASGALLLAAAVGLALALGRWISSLLGGMTGDAYGAVNEVAEVSMLLLGIAIYSLAPEIYWPTVW